MGDIIVAKISVLLSMKTVFLKLVQTWGHSEAKVIGMPNKSFVGSVNGCLRTLMVMVDPTFVSSSDAVWSKIKLHQAAILLSLCCCTTCMLVVLRVQVYKAFKHFVINFFEIEVIS